MRSWLKTPAFWLALQMAVAAGLVHVRGWGIVHHVPDSQSYIQTGFMAPVAMLASVRTIGYPLFLRAVAAVSPDLAVLPQAHLAIHFLAVLLFCWALRRFGATAWQAFAAGTGVLWTVFHDPQVHDVASDSLARSMAVVTVACLLSVAATPRRVWPWIALTLSLAYTYHIRPAYLFLVPLFPVLGLLLLAIHAAWHRGPFYWKRPTLALAAVALIPFLAFCTLRLAVVGHFGLVSFGGLNIAGLAVELLDRPLLQAHVPQDLQAAALEMLDLREEVHRRRGAVGAFRDGRLNLPQLRQNFDADIYEAAAPPVVRRHSGAGNESLLWLAVNRDLTRLSRSVLMARKGVYLRFVVDNFRLGLYDLPATNVTLPVLAALAVFLCAARNLVWPGKTFLASPKKLTKHSPQPLPGDGLPQESPRSPMEQAQPQTSPRPQMKEAQPQASPRPQMKEAQPQASPRPLAGEGPGVRASCAAPYALIDNQDAPRCYTMQLAIVLGVTFVLSGVLLLSVSHMTTGRYLISAALFLPSIFTLWILQEVQQIATALRVTYGSLDGQENDLAQETHHMTTAENKGQPGQ